MSRGKMKAKATHDDLVFSGRFDEARDMVSKCLENYHIHISSFE